MELQSRVNSKFNLLPSMIPIRTVKSGLFTNSRLSNSKIESRTISDPDPIADRDDVDKNKSFYLFNFKLFHTQQWCQKWDIYQVNVFYYLVTIFTNFKHNFNKICNINYHFIYVNLIDIFPLYYNFYLTPNCYNDMCTLPPSFPNRKPSHKLFYVRHDLRLFKIILDDSETISYAKVIIGNLIGHDHTKFYLCSGSKYLNESRVLGMFHLTNSEIVINFRLNGGGEIRDDNVSVATPPANLHRPFFLDKENTPNTWLLLLEFSFSNHQYSSFTKAQHLTAFLPTEILQELGPKIISVMRLNKLECDYFSEISNLVKDFYKPSESDLFEQYFRTQSLGSLSPSQFLAKACTDLEQLHPGSSSNVNILRRSFLAVLPPTARAILAGSERSSLVDLANIADKVLENLPSRQVSNIEPTINDLVKNLADQVASLQSEISAQRRARSPLRKPMHATRDRSKSLSRILCTFHFKQIHLIQDFHLNRLNHLVTFNDNYY